MDDREFSGVPGIEDGFLDQSTSLPEAFADESGHVAVLIIFVVCAVLAITLIFILAVFIDCRQEKLAKIEKTSRPRRQTPGLKILRVLKTVGEDEDSFADKEQPQCEDAPPSTSTNNIV